jgi:hypothetical protein
MAGMQRQYLRIRNSRSEDLSIYIEPWGDELLIAADAICEIASDGPSDGFLEVESAEDRLTVYGWPGSTLSVYQDGQLVCDCTVQAPQTPRKV